MKKAIISIVFISVLILLLTACPKKTTQYRFEMLEHEGNGTITPEVGTSDYDENAEITLIATPDGGWKFVKWEVNNEFYSNECEATLTMNSDKVVKAFFDEIQEAFLTLVDGSVVKITEDGTSSTGIITDHFCVDDNNKILFTLTKSYNYSSGELELINEYNLPEGFIYSNYGIIASVNNSTDIVDFYNYNGTFIKSIKIIDEPNHTAQNSFGIFLDEDTFLLSEDGDNNLIQFNISEGTTEIYRSFSDSLQWIGVFYKLGNDFYIYTITGSSIYKFRKYGIPVLVDESFPNNIAGMIVEEDKIHFVSNYANGYFTYDRTTKEWTKIEELHFPRKLSKITY
jgi:hypothetical protein